MGGAEGKPAKFGAVGGGGGVGTIGEPELHSAGDGGEETSAPFNCSIPSTGDPAFLFFIALVSLGDLTGLLKLVFKVAAAAAAADPPAMVPAAQAITEATGWCTCGCRQLAPATDAAGRCCWMAPAAATAGWHQMPLLLAGTNFCYCCCCCGGPLLLLPGSCCCCCLPAVAVYLLLLHAGC